MTEHYTRNTTEATAWCNQCNRMTQHRVDSGRRGPCLACLEERKEHQTPVKAKIPPFKPPKDGQGKLFES